MYQPKKIEKAWVQSLNGSKKDPYGTVDFSSLILFLCVSVITVHVLIRLTWSSSIVKTIGHLCVLGV